MNQNYEDFSVALKEAKDRKTLGVVHHGVVTPTMIFPVGHTPTS